MRQDFYDEVIIELFDFDHCMNFYPKNANGQYNGEPIENWFIQNLKQHYARATLKCVKC